MYDGRRSPLVSSLRFHFRTPVSKEKNRPARRHRIVRVLFKYRTVGGLNASFNVNHRYPALLSRRMPVPAGIGLKGDAIERLQPWTI